jgi:hypothetical protein
MSEGGLLALSYIERYRRYFLVVKVQNEVKDPGGFYPEIGDGKNQMGYGGGVPYSLYFYISLYGRYAAHFTVKIPGFYSEIVAGKLPKVIAEPDDYRELGMNARESPGNDGVKSSDNGKFSAVFLGKITESEDFCLHGIIYFSLRLFRNVKF